MNKFTFALILFNSLFVSIETANAQSLINNHRNSDIEIERKTANVDEIFLNKLVLRLFLWKTWFKIIESPIV